MKKIIMFGLATTVFATSANAGFLDMLGLGKKKEPATLEQACNKDDITKICPETILGTKTMTECLVDNINNLSTQCANFVKKSATEKIESTKAAAADKVADATVKSDGRAADVTAKSDAARADAVAKKAAATAAVRDASDNVKQTGDSLKETGKTLKSLF